MDKTYTIETKLFGTITGTEKQIEELVFAVNAQAVHYHDLMDSDPKEGAWKEWWWNYTTTSTDIWKKLQEAKKNG